MSSASWDVSKFRQLYPVHTHSKAPPVPGGKIQTRLVGLFAVRSLITWAGVPSSSSFFPFPFYTTGLPRGFNMLNRAVLPLVWGLFCLNLLHPGSLLKPRCPLPLSHHIAIPAPNADTQSVTFNTHTHTADSHKTRGFNLPGWPLPANLGQVPTLSTHMVPFHSLISAFIPFTCDRV